MFYLRFIISVILGLALGYFLLGLLPWSSNLEELSVHPSTLMVFILVGFGLGMGAGYAVCYTRSSEDEILLVLSNYSNLWVLAFVAIVSAYLRLHLTNPGFAPMTTEVMQKYQLIFGFVGILVSLAICLLKSRRVRVDRED